MLLSSEEQIYNISLSLHWFCLTLFFKSILCLNYLWLDIDSDWRMRQEVWTVVVRFVDVIKKSTDSGRMHRLGNASSSPQSSEGCSVHHVPSPTNDLIDGWILIMETVISDSSADWRFGIWIMKFWQTVCRFWAAVQIWGRTLGYTLTRAFRVSTRLRSSF
jgi:hypothetical protein